MPFSTESLKNVLSTDAVIYYFLFLFDDDYLLLLQNADNASVLILFFCFCLCRRWRRNHRTTASDMQQIDSSIPQLEYMRYNNKWFFIVEHLCVANSWAAPHPRTTIDLARMSVSAVREQTKKKTHTIENTAIKLCVC